MLFILTLLHVYAVVVNKNYYTNVVKTSCNMSFNVRLVVVFFCFLLFAHFMRQKTKNNSHLLSNTFKLFSGNPKFIFSNQFWFIRYHNHNCFNCNFPCPPVDFIFKTLTIVCDLLFIWSLPSWYRNLWQRLIFLSLLSLIVNILNVWKLA